MIHSASDRGAADHVIPLNWTGSSTSWTSRPVTTSFPALTTMTKSPLSKWSAKVGFPFPMSSPETFVARRPKVCPSASITYQRRSISAARGVQVFSFMTAS